MKRILSFFSAFFIFLQIINTQSVPQGMKFQAMARDQQGAILAEQPIYLQVTLRKGGPEGEIVFREWHRAVTNELGLVNLVIGEGDTPSTLLGNVPWETGDIWLDLGLSQPGNTSFRTIHTARLLAMPYAMHAQTAEAILPPETEKDYCNNHGQPNWNIDGHGNPGDPLIEDNYFVGTHNQQALVMKTNSQEWMRITGDQKIKVKGILRLEDLLIDANANYRGNLADEQFKNYPLRLKGGAQGIGIWIDGHGSTKNNFVSFWDTTGVLGRIEGQTRKELWDEMGLQYQYDQYIVENIGQIIEELYSFQTADDDASYFQSAYLRGAIGAALPMAEMVACMIQLDINEGIVNGLWAGVNAGQLAWTLLSALNNAGIAYVSGGADYAEWLEKANPEDQFVPGEVVGLHHGKISRNTDAADQVMVISGHPVVLGNMPPEGVRQNYTKVAFLGQVPVLVLGEVKAGDFILPSGQHDGLAIGRPAEKMQLEDYQKVIGVAWSDPASKPLSLIRVAVGLPVSEMAAQVRREKEEVEALRADLDRVMCYLALNDPTAPGKAFKPDPGDLSAQSEISESPSFEEWMSTRQDIFTRSFHQLRDFYEKQGYDLEAYPALKRLLEEPEKALRNYYEANHQQMILRLPNDKK